MAGKARNFLPNVDALPPLRRAGVKKSSFHRETAWTMQGVSQASRESMQPPSGPHSPARLQAGLALGALGVVFGDIGTSPLYTMRECMAHLPPVERAEGILGVLSLIFWA